MSLDTLIVVVLFLFLGPLLSVLGPWLRKQLEALAHQAEEAGGRGRPPAAASVRRPAATEVAGKALRESPAAKPARPPASSGSGPGATALPGLRGRRELQHGIVLMTVLGPCRALDPP